jgi:solute:Na+ symporter, SSS family
MLDVIVIVAYLLIIISVSVLSYSKKHQNIFGSEKMVPWWILGMSYFITNNDIINSLPKMGILLDRGYSGLWIYYTAFLSAGIVPIIFSPMWGKLKFMTDNQFILFRFSGKSAKILHGFRAVYVGYLVVALMISMYIIATTKLLVVYFNIEYNLAFGIVSLLSLLIVFKNSFIVKVRTDVLNGVIFIITFIISAIYILNYAGGVKIVYHTLNTDFYEQTRLFPQEGFTNSFETLPNLLIFFLVQWWSINVLDGGGHEAQRFMTARNPSNAFKVAILPIIFITIVFIFKSIIFDTGIFLHKINIGIIPLANETVDNEAYFVGLFANILPDGLHALAFIAFFIGFVTCYESFLNWGSGFVSVDFIHTYIKKQEKEKQKVWHSYLIMYLITLTALLIAYFNQYMLGLQKFIFSMAAGVGPVFILRWFWWRVNAWSQLSAMLSSLIFTVSFDLLYKYFVGFHNTFNFLLAQWNFSYYPLKLLILTFLVTITWLVVTFLTKPDDHEHLKNYVEKVKPLGWWPKGFNVQNGIAYKKILLILIYALVSILPFVFVWLIKFHSVVISIMLFIIWLIFIWIIFKYNSNFEKPKT